LPVNKKAKNESPQLHTTCKGASDFFYFHILNITKIWLNILVDDCHYITKLGEKKSLLGPFN
jgi:hypothetical protein